MSDERDVEGFPLESGHVPAGPLLAGGVLSFSVYGLHYVLSVYFQEGRGLGAARQTGSVMGIGLLGGLIGRPGDVVTGTRHALLIAAGLLAAGAFISWRGGRGREPEAVTSPRSGR